MVPGYCRRALARMRSNHDPDQYPEPKIAQMKMPKSCGAFIRALDILVPFHRDDDGLF
jgi:hypothetical protein